MTNYRPSSGERLLTVEDFERLPEEDGYRLELRRGWIVREPAPGVEHGWLDAKLTVRLAQHVEEQKLGIVLANTGYVLSSEPATVRVPDLSFVSAERIPPEPLTTGFWRFAPDLAVEIVSPSNSASDIQETVLEYLTAGARLVWVVHPRKKTVTVYRSRTEIQILTEADTLDGGAVLPGFSVSVAELFARAT